MKYNLVLMLSLFISPSSFAQSEPIISEQQSSMIYKQTKAFPENTELSIAFIKNGEVSYYGIKRVKDTIVYVQNSNHLFEIGSITKVFTSTLLANLVLEKKVKLNHPIQDYLPFPLKNKEITVLQLANHTSGLPRLPSNLDLGSADPFNPYADYDVEDLKQYLSKDMEVDSAMVNQYEYSNVGAGILGYLLEVQTGLNYEALLQKYVFSKYKMKSSTTQLENIHSEMVKGRDAIGDVTANWNLNALVGAGGIISNVEDLTQFLTAQFDSTNRELALTRKSTLEIPQYRMEVGLAWNIIQPDSTQTWQMHNGGTGGYTSIMALDTDSQNGIIILSNVSAFHPKSRNIDQMCLGLMKSQY